MPARVLNFLRLLSSLLCIVSLSIGSSAENPDHSKVEAVHISGRMRDRDTGKGIDAARIRVLHSNDNAPWRTDQDGQFSFWLAKRELDRIEIEAEGYGMVSLVPMSGTPLKVGLTPESADTSTRGFLRRNKAFPLLPPSQGIAPAIITADSGPKR